MNVNMPCIRQIRDSEQIFTRFQEYEELLAERSICSRIFSKDVSIWSESGVSPIPSDRCLDWTDSFQRSLPTVTEVPQLSKQVDTVVLIGMGGASLAVRVYAEVCCSETRRTLRILDSTSPDFLAKALQQPESKDNYYVVSSKSGNTVETLDIARTVFERVGCPSQFSVLTDPCTGKLREWAKDNDITSFVSDSYVPGRFSALSSLGLIPIKILGIDLSPLQELIDDHVGMMKISDSSYGIETRQLAAAMACAATEPGSRMLLSANANLLPALQWIEQIVGESLGKSGHGVLPVIQVPMSKETDNDELQVCLCTEQTESALIFQTRLSNISQLARMFLTFETAISMAAYLISVNPFDQPDVEHSKQIVSDSLDSDNNRSRPITDQEIGVNRSADSVQKIQEAILKLESSIGIHDYVALLAYVSPTAENEQMLSEIAKNLKAIIGRSVVQNFGPQYLHSTGQFHKGGPATGNFLIIQTDQDADIDVARQSYTFGRLMELQASVDTEVLRELGRPVYQFRVMQPVTKSLQNLAEAIRSVGRI